MKKQKNINRIQSALPIIDDANINEYNRINNDYNLIRDIYYKRYTEDEIKALFKDHTKNVERAAYLTERLSNKTATEDEIIETLTHIFNQLETMPVKFISLYSGIYKKALEALYKNYPHLKIQELLSSYELKNLTMILKVALERVQNGSEGTRGTCNIMRTIKMVGELMQISNENGNFSEQLPSLKVIQQFDT